MMIWILNQKVENPWRVSNAVTLPGAGARQVPKLPRRGDGMSIFLRTMFMEDLYEPVCNDLLLSGTKLERSKLQASFVLSQHDGRC